MAFEKLKIPGVSRAMVICDECDHRADFPCGYSKKSERDGHQPNEGQLIQKATHAGWSFIKKTMRCPACEKKRKIDMTNSKTTPAETPPREPSRMEKLQIIDMLKEVYDIKNERYKANDTDETVADVLGVMPGWVAQVRDDLFGPAGGNENIDELIGRLERIQKEGEQIKAMATALHDKAEKKLAEVSAMAAELERIKKAVGPRMLRVAGVK